MSLLLGGAGRVGHPRLMDLQRLVSVDRGVAGGLALHLGAELGPEQHDRRGQLSAARAEAQPKLQAHKRPFL
ncbi:hypothetical protein C0214_06570 [Methylobacterium sp. DM1]|nr:hypothetical protein C0214_06570 [Methylobacterium sp. DM1]